MDQHINILTMYGWIWFGLVISIVAMSFPGDVSIKVCFNFNGFSREQAPQAGGLIL